ncbi:MAG: NAD(P)H-binding protein [Cyclobacteriaceae bacterium]
MQSKQKEKLLLLGATGRTGRLVLQNALAKGHAVNCLARNSNRIKPQEGLTIFEGNPINENDLNKALVGCETVISVLNISRKSDFPWSGLKTPKTYLSDVMEKLVSVAGEQGIKKVVICSAWGVAESKDDIPKWFKWFIDNSNISYAYKDHERQEQLLMASNLKWTIVRPVGLVNSKRQQLIRETFGNQPKPSLTISRQSVAIYMLDALKNDRLIGKKVVVSKG